MKKDKRKLPEKRRFWTIFVLMSLLLPYFQIVGSAFPKRVVAETGESILINKKDVLTVETGYEEQGQEVKWHLHYEKPKSEKPRQFQFKIQVGTTIIPIEKLTEEIRTKFVTSAEGWLTEKDFGRDSVSGNIQFVTSKNETPQVFLQMIEEEAIASNSEGEQAQEVTVIPLLSAVEIGPYHLQISEEPTEETSSTTTENPSESSTGQSSETTPSSTENSEETTETSELEGEAQTGTQDSSDGSQSAGKYYSRSMNVKAMMYGNLIPQYTTNTTGTFPTANWIPNGNTNVLNHIGAEKNDSWNTASTDHFINYYATGSSRTEADFGINKYAQEVPGQQGLFDIFLEARGNTIDTATAQPIDILIIADRSGSMVNNNSTRWANLKTGVIDFMDTITDLGLQDTIHMGYVSFAEHASSLNETGTGLTSYKSIPIGSVTTNRSLINTQLGKTVTGGTNTQAGLLEAENVLAERESSKREGTKTVVVLLTDGVPTFHYEVTGVEANAELTDGYRVTSYDDSSRKGSGSRARLRASGGNASQREYDVANGNGRIKNNFTAPQSVAYDIKQKNVEIRVIGVELTGEADDNEDFPPFTFTEVTERMQNMATPKPDGSGEYYYTNVDAASQIVNELNNIAHELTSTVANATINDPMGDGILYQNVSGLTVTQTVNTGGDIDSGHMPNAVFDPETNAVSVSNINVGKDQTVQIKYRVRIDTEAADFVPEKWYPANGQTTFNVSGNLVDFGVPSIKAPGVKLNIIKNWVGDEEADRPDNLNFNVTRQSTTSDSSWTAGTVTLTKTENTGSAIWEKTDIHQITVNNNLVYLPKFNNQGENFTYTVTEDLTGIEKYIPTGGATDETNLNYEFTNKLVSLEIRKVDGAGNLLKEATFTLFSPGNKQTSYTTVDGKLFLKELAVGEYILREDVSPNGYEISGNHYHFEVHSDGTITGCEHIPIKEENGLLYGEVVNDKIIAQIIVNKVDAMSNLTLDGVEFTLTSSDGEVVSKTGENGNLPGQILFDNLDWEKEYTLVESSQLAGYLPFETEIHFNFDLETGKWQVTPADQENLVIDENNNGYSITLLVKNQPLTVLPETGGNSRMLLFLSGGLATLISGAALYYSYKRNQLT